MTIDEDVVMKKSLTLRGVINASLLRSNLIADLAQVYPLLPQNFRVHDAFQTALGTAGTDDLGVAGGAFGTNCPYLTTSDLNAAGAVTQYGRTLFQLPPEYTAQGNVKVNLAAGMLTSVAGTSATVDVEAYLVNRDTLISGSDLVTTAAQSCNSLTFADLPFTVTAAGLTPGAILDIRVAFIGNSATATSHFGAIAAAEMLLDIKG